MEEEKKKYQCNNAISSSIETSKFSLSTQLD